MSITIRINNVNCKFSESPSETVVEHIRTELRYKNDADNPFIKRKFYKKNVQIAEYKYLYHKGQKSFPTGLLNIVEDILKKNNVDYILEDQRPSYPIKDPIPLLGYGLRDYQKEAEKQVLESQNCIVRIATGGGKTAIMASLAGKLHGYNQIVFVRRQMLLAQTIEVFKRELGIEIGQLGAGVVDIKPLTIAMIPTVARAIDDKWSFQAENDDDEDDSTKLNEKQREEIRKYLSSCESITIDECHCLGADTAQLVSNYAANARYRIGLSGSPWRDDGKDILLSAVTGPRVVDIDASFLIERGFLVAPHIYFFETPPTRIPLFQQGKYQDVYKEFMVENQSRNQLILDKTIEAYNRFEKVLILVQQVEHGKILQKALEEDGVWVDYLSGKNTAVTRKEVINQFRQRSRSVLIGSSILNEGVDLPEITVLINAAGGKSSVQYYQKIGRALRLCDDKNRAIVIDFLDQGIRFMDKHARARIKIIRTESLYKLKIQGEQ